MKDEKDSKIKGTTYGELFREVIAKIDGKVPDPTQAKYADSVAPTLINQEIPPDRLEDLRFWLEKVGREIDKLPLAEKKAMLSRMLSRN